MIIGIKCTEKIFFTFEKLVWFLKQDNFKEKCFQKEKARVNGLC